jgi:hypothetical protein
LLQPPSNISQLPNTCFYGTFAAVLRTLKMSIRSEYIGFGNYVYPHEQPKLGSTNFQEIRYEVASAQSNFG